MTENKDVPVKALMEQTRVDRLDQLANLPEFRVNKQPSRAEVIRRALDMLFADYDVRFSEHSDDKVAA